MAKGKMPPQLVEYFKNKNAKKDDGTEMSDKEKRKAALEKAKKYKEQKKNKVNKSSKDCDTCQHPEIQKHPAEIDNAGRHV